MNPSYDNSFGSFSSGQGGNTNQPGYSGGSVGSNNQFGGGQQVSSSAPMGEPIKLDNGGRKKSKKWVVILRAILILGGAAIGGLVAWRGMVEHENMKKSVLRSFYDLASYVMGGGSDEENETTLSGLTSRYEDLVEEYSIEPDMLLYAVSIREEKSFESIKEYYEKLDKKTQVLREVAEGVVEEKTLNRYVASLKLLKNAIDYRTVRDGLLAVYENDGESGAESYLQRNIICEDREWPLSSICYDETNYYRAFLEEYIEGDNGEGLAYQYLMDVLSGDTLRFLNLGVREMQNRFLEELKND